MVCGPTASGKTAYAHDLAKKYNGEIVNSDAMQVYKFVPILTASPEQSLREELPYHLYNFLDLHEEFSVIKYLNLSTEVIKEIVHRKKTPIIVGGSGMYINGLLYGYNELPSIEESVRESARLLYDKIGKEEFFAKLKSIDPLAASIIKPNDSQRMLRAYEIMMQCGQSIFRMIQTRRTIPLINFDFKVLYLNPEREILYKNCNERLVRIFQSGAIDEAQNIKPYYASIKGSANKLIGLKELIMYLDNTITLEIAISLAQARTRQYAKRQTTWFNNKLVG